MNNVHFSTKTSDDEVSTSAPCLSVGQAPGSRRVALKVFFSSLSIQSSFNHHGMQNIGFAFSILPFAKRMGDKRDRISTLLARHLQLFNTHPYLSGPIIGSVLHMEETSSVSGNDNGGAAVANLENTLMGPYAALGDSFFWGALKLLAAVFSVVLAIQQTLLAPLAFLFLYNPPHIWIRSWGFVEGYRRGEEGIDFIRMLGMPRLTGRIRWVSLAGLGCLAAFAGRLILHSFLGYHIDIIARLLY